MHRARRNGRRLSPALSVEEIEAFARLVGTTKRTFFRLGYGFARQRNGSVNMHAALSIPAVTGGWQYEGGGAFHSNSGILKLNTELLEGIEAARSAHPLSRPFPHRPGADGR